MAEISKILKHVAVFKDGDGNIIKGNLSATAVIASDGSTLQAHVESTNTHVTAAEKAYLTAAGTANGVALLDANGYIPASAVNSAMYPVEQTVADIAARDALTDTSDGAKVFVTDASADATVASGWAIYRYHVAVGETPAGWTKVAEAESLDVITDWANITNKPASTVTSIDDAVTASHTHANSSVLDLLTESNGALQYNGAQVGNTLLASAVVTSVPASWPATVRDDGILFLVEEEA